MPNGASAFTQKAIKEAFVRLLEQRPVNKITVKDIVTECGINRNTFYYHFQDIPTLLEQIAEDNVAEVISACPDIASLEQCMDVVLDFALKKKRVVLNIYSSADRGIFERSLLSLCEYVVDTCMEHLLHGRQLVGEDREIIVRYYQSELFGQIIIWLNEGMMTDVRAPFHRLCRLRESMVEQFLDSIAQ